LLEEEESLELSVLEPESVDSVSDEPESVELESEELESVVLESVVLESVVLESVELPVDSWSVLCSCWVSLLSVFDVSWELQPINAAAKTPTSNANFHHLRFIGTPPCWIRMISSFSCTNCRARNHEKWERIETKM
jgi:hypothetical protein